jgi:hypothetical protein
MKRKATVGRPKKADAARDQLNLRLRPGERERLLREATRAERKLSEWARLVLLAAAPPT